VFDNNDNLGWGLKKSAQVAITLEDENNRTNIINIKRMQPSSEGPELWYRVKVSPD
jgi:hypothetical protein